MNTQLKFAIEWLDHRHKTLQEVVKNVEENETEFMRGFRNGIEFATKTYEEELQNIRQLLKGYLVEDVDLSGMKEGEEIA